MLVDFRDCLQRVEDFPIQTLLDQFCEAVDAAHQHVQMIQGRDRGRQVPLGRVQLFDVASDLLDHVLCFLGAGFDFRDLCKKLIDHLLRPFQGNSSVLASVRLAAYYATNIVINYAHFAFHLGDHVVDIRQ